MATYQSHSIKSVMFKETEINKTTSVSNIRHLVGYFSLPEHLHLGMEVVIYSTTRMWITDMRPCCLGHKSSNFKIGLLNQEL
jgi:hypothetical protein